MHTHRSPAVCVLQEEEQGQSASRTELLRTAPPPMQHKQDTEQSCHMTGNQYGLR